VVLELQLGAVSLLAAVTIAVEEKDQLVKERSHLEVAECAVGMEAPPEVSKAVRCKEASAATGGVVHIVLIIKTVDLRGACGMDVKVGVQFLRADAEGSSAGASRGGERVAEERGRGLATFVVGRECRQGEQEWCSRAPVSAGPTGFGLGWCKQKMGLEVEGNDIKSRDNAE